MVAAVGADETLAKVRLRPLVRAKAAVWSRGDVDQWLAESHRIAIRYVYPRLPTPPACGAPTAEQVIPERYLQDAVPIVRSQFAKAAVRLAKVLNETLG